MPRGSPLVPDPKLEPKDLSSEFPPAIPVADAVRVLETQREDDAWFLPISEELCMRCKIDDALPGMLMCAECAAEARS